MRDDGTYIINDDEGVSCVMFYFKAKINIYYPDTKGDYLVRRDRYNRLLKLVFMSLSHVKTQMCKDNP